MQYFRFPSHPYTASSVFIMFYCMADIRCLGLLWETQVNLSLTRLGVEKQVENDLGISLCLLKRLCFLFCFNFIIELSNLLYSFSGSYGTVRWKIHWYDWWVEFRLSEQNQNPDNCFTTDGRKIKAWLSKHERGPVSRSSYSDLKTNIACWLSRRLQKTRDFNVFASALRPTAETSVRATEVYSGKYVGEILGNVIVLGIFF